MSGSTAITNLPVLLLLAALVVGVSLGVGVLVVVRPRSEVHGVQRSLDLVRTTGEAGLGIAPAASGSAQDRLVRPFVGWLVQLARRITPIGTAARLRRRLDLAGNPQGLDVEALLACKAGGTIVGLVMGLGLLVLHRSPVIFAVAAVLVAAGYWLTDLLLYNTALHRQERLRRDAPDVIDMLTVCVEAGLGFDAALAQVARNTRGPLAAEVSRMLQEMQLGRSRAEAFTGFGERTDVPELNSFVSALVQADRLGVPIAQVLREQSSEIRLRRRQRAEEQAQKLPVKIIFPVVLCIFPALLIITVGPGAIQIARMFSSL